MSENRVILEKIIELSDTVHDLKMSHEKSEVERSKLSDTLSQHMQNEEIIIPQVMNSIDALTRSVAELGAGDHIKHHEFVNTMIEEQQAKREFWDGVKATVASGGIWGVMTALGSIVWFAITQYFGTKGG